MAGFLDRERTIAGPGFNRWMVPPAALCIHLCIGQVYAFSVFNLPMTRLIGVTESAPEDWKLTTLGWIFSISIVCLGLSAAFAGRWLEQVGPRKAMLLSATCFGGGFLVSALGIWLHVIWLVYLGYGVLGGIGLGIGYISPVSTLIKWFPDRPGMATGMAIMGFGGGAMIGSPLAVGLMDLFSGPESVGVAPTFLTMGLIYFTFMAIGALLVRLPPEGWLPAGYQPPVESSKLITTAHVHVDEALKTPQFYLVWMVLFLNVSAGIGVLGQASAMSQEMMPGKIEAAAAAGFVGLLSIFNMVGRFVWASTSDYLGRKKTYLIFFALGMALYAAVPPAAAMGSVLLYVLCYCVIMSMYGGGFATVPAYLKDLFGTMHVGAIHGRLLTAWAAAGVMGPVLINYIREFQIEAGVPKAQAYTVTMYIMVALLFLGLICNALIRAVDSRHHYVGPESEGSRS
ncbi:L-lactate MFS transporter [Spectribacter hydrogenooxidans]|uniref:OFA family MFS transporter n=1 Tax=Spectribacter hydrogenoxidans TaxID=3075608 RepID=A0ABU3C3P8_9GAMM|nr:OFA family MFS transporter [Salinisphaera sp. W335]MDT0636176.1 OFA family MFS transporter [Salinisphaera sp. W335]